jgi:hypothetical protein
MTDKATESILKGGCAEMASSGVWLDIPRCRPPARGRNEAMRCGEMMSCGHLNAGGGL